MSANDILVTQNVTQTLIITFLILTRYAHLDRYILREINFKFNFLINLARHLSSNARNRRKKHVLLLSIELIIGIKKMKLKKKLIVSVHRVLHYHQFILIDR